MQRFMDASAAGILLAIAIGFFTGDQRQGAKVQPLPVAVTPVLVEVKEVPSPEPIETKQDAGKAAEQFQAVLAGSQQNFALAELDAWIHGLKTGGIVLSGRDLRADFEELVSESRAAGATSDELAKHFSDLLEVAKSKRSMESDLPWLVARIAEEKDIVTLADTRRADQ